MHTPDQSENKVLIPSKKLALSETEAKAVIKGFMKDPLQYL